MPPKAPRLRLPGAGCSLLLWPTAHFNYWGQVRQVWLVQMDEALQLLVPQLLSPMSGQASTSHIPWPAPTWWVTSPSGTDPSSVPSLTQSR